AFNDIMMLAGKAERKLDAQLFIKIDTALLVAQMLAMHERKIEELALVGRQLPVEIMIKCLCRYVSSQPVAFERSTLAAEHIARKLTAHNGNLQSTFRSLFSPLQLFGTRIFLCCQKLLTNFGVLLVTFAKPVFPHPGRKPAIENILRLDSH